MHSVIGEAEGTSPHAGRLADCLRMAQHVAHRCVSEQPLVPDFKRDGMHSMIRAFRHEGTDAIRGQDGPGLPEWLDTVVREPRSS